MKTDNVVAVFSWGGSRPIYQPWHAENMRRMVQKHLSIPHRFVVVTDNVPAYEAAGLEAFPLWDCPRHREMRTNWINCYVRLGLFDKTLGGALGGRILSIDLDTVIRAPIDDFFEGPDPFKILALKSRTWLQGGLFRVDPGKVNPCPWDQMMRNAETNIFDRSEPWVGSDQAILSELFYKQVREGTIPSWNESDGVVVNDFNAPWRVFFRTGHKKCWYPGVQERAEYLAQSDRTDVPADMPLLFNNEVARVPRKTIQRRQVNPIGRSSNLRWMGGPKVIR
jgi:hypothetical protein